MNTKEEIETNERQLEEKVISGLISDNSPTLEESEYDGSDRLKFKVNNNTFFLEALSLFGVDFGSIELYYESHSREYLYTFKKPSSKLTATISAIIKNITDREKLEHVKSALEYFN